jgi:hypothetical protein
LSNSDALLEQDNIACKVSDSKSEFRRHAMSYIKRTPAKGDTINYIYTNTQHKNPLLRVAALALKEHDGKDKCSKIAHVSIINNWNCRESHCKTNLPLTTL